MALRDADQAPQPFADNSDEGRIKALVAENARLYEEVAARDNFLAVVAHELNNALTPVVARIDLLIDRFDDWPMDKIQGNLVLIQQAASTFTKRTMVLMNVSRIRRADRLAEKRERPNATGEVSRRCSLR